MSGQARKVDATSVYGSAGTRVNYEQTVRPRPRRRCTGTPVQYEQTVRPRPRRRCTGKPIHYEQTVRPPAPTITGTPLKSELTARPARADGAKYIGTQRANAWMNHAWMDAMLRPTTAFAPVHYEQTVRPRVHRYTMSKQSDPGYTGTL